MENAVVVTRHAGLVEYLREQGIVAGDVRVIAHATPEDVRGREVIGVLPLHLAALATSVLEVPLALTAADRAAGDLPVERVRQIAGAPVRYRVGTWTEGGWSEPRGCINCHG